jgi:predicted transcriptional regulator
METTISKIKQRSSSYPSIPLTEAVDLVAQIYQNYGKNHLVNRNDIASVLGVSSATIQTKISSCAQYGLVEKKQGEGYKPTDLFLKIYKPISEEEKKQAELTALSTPKLYSELISEYNNHALPNSLPSILSRNYSIVDAAAPKAAEIFIKNVWELGFLDDNRILNLTPISNEVVEGEIEERQEPIRVKQAHITGKSRIVQGAQSEQNVVNSDLRNIDIALPKGRKAFLQLPINITKKDIEIIRAQLAVVELSIETESTT